MIVEIDYKKLGQRIRAMREERRRRKMSGRLYGFKFISENNGICACVQYNASDERKQYAHRV